MCHRPDILPDLRLVGLVSGPVDEPLVVFFDEHLPFGLRQHAPPDADRAVADPLFLPGPAIGVSARVGGAGEHVVDRVVGRLHPGDLLSPPPPGGWGPLPETRPLPAPPAQARPD